MYYNNRTILRPYQLSLDLTIIKSLESVSTKFFMFLMTKLKMFNLSVPLLYTNTLEK